MDKPSVENALCWKGVDTSIIIPKGKAITIILDDKETDNHFKGQYIYGTVKSFISN